MKYRLSLGLYHQTKAGNYLVNFIDIFNNFSKHFEIVPQFLNSYEILKDKDSFIPDIITTYTTDIASLAKSDLLVSLSDFFSSNIEGADIYSEVLKSTKYSDNIWMLPLIEGNPYSIIYDKVIFNRSGIKNAPTTWEDLLRYASLITNDTNGDGIIDQWGIILKFNILYLFIWQNEGDILDENGRIIFDNEIVAETLQFLLLLKKYSSPHPEFEKGNIGVTYSRLTDIEKYKSINFDISYIPFNKKRINSFGGKKGVLGFSIVNKKEKILSGCYEFLRWWYDTENYTKWCKETNFIPLRKSVLASEEYQKYIENNKFIKILIDEIEFCRVIPNFQNFLNVQNILINILENTDYSGDNTLIEIKEKLIKAKNSIG